MRCLAAIIFCGLAASPALAQTTQPSDTTMDWLLDQAESAPATQPAADSDQPQSPLTRPDEAEARPASITLSNGTILEGSITTTPDKPIRIWDERNETYRDIPFRLIRSFEAHILWERDEPEWRFIDSGSDIKEQTGRTYPAREMEYTVTLVNDQTLRGGIVAPLYHQPADGSRRQTLVLHKRQKGDPGQTLEQLTYLQKVEMVE